MSNTDDNPFAGHVTDDEPIIKRQGGNGRFGGLRSMSPGNHKGAKPSQPKLGPEDPGKALSTAEIEDVKRILGIIQDLQTNLVETAENLGPLAARLSKPNASTNARHSGARAHGLMGKFLNMADELTLTAKYVGSGTPLKARDANNTNIMTPKSRFNPLVMVGLLIVVLIVLAITGNLSF